MRLPSRLLKALRSDDGTARPSFEFINSKRFAQAQNLPISDRRRDRRARPKGVALMSKSRWVPGIVPYGADQTAYVIVDHLAGPDDFQEIEKPDLESVIADLMSGAVNDPHRVIAFNTLEHWSEDISGQVAREIQSRCDMAGDRVPEHIRDFVEEFAALTVLKTRAGTARSSAPAM